MFADMKTRAEVQKAYRERRMRENAELVRALERERWRRRCIKNRAMRVASAEQHSDGNTRLLHLVDKRTYASIPKQANYTEKPSREDALHTKCDVHASAAGRKPVKTAKKTSKKRTVAVTWEPLYSE